METVCPGLYSEHYYAREIGLKSSACLSNFLKKMTGMTFLEFCNKVIDQNLDINWSCPSGVRLDTLDEEMLHLMEKSGCYSLSVSIRVHPW